MEKIRTLIVEDEIFVARDLQMTLEQMGYSATSMVPSGEQAIKEIEHEVPDLVLMDIVLQEGMDGVETAEIIHSRFDIPVIFLTAHGDKTIFERAKKTEPFGYVTKPFQEENLRKSIEIALLRHKSEQERKALVEEIETVNKELRDFVYTVSHDLKEPLFSIDCYVSMLHIASENEFDEKSNGYIDRIKANVGVMSSRIDEILEVAKIGMVAYHFTDNASAEIVRDVIVSHGLRIESSGISVYIQPGLPIVKCDRNKLMAVISNLLTNAIKFMGDDKQRLITVGCERREDDYRFFVEDTGIGIRKEYHENIFRIFRRLKDIDVEGSGVGLSIVRKIIERHKGKVWVESPINNERGTRLNFTIPISQQKG